MAEQQQISCVTLGVADLARSKRFYVDGFGWAPVLDTAEIVFYQMNGLMLGTWLKRELEGDVQRGALAPPGAFTLAHNVPMQADVQPLLDRLVAHGGTLLRRGGATDYGGFRGYIADPDQHTWEIAWNPSWPISPEGYVSFK
jgi:catechol 2,3-dioxygenase-like lactoylglutathione lyase family enzyme